MQSDSEEPLSSISEDLFVKAASHTKLFVDINNPDIKAIMHYCKSVPHNNPWVKKGSSDAMTCELDKFILYMFYIQSAKKTKKVDTWTMD